MSSLPLNCVHNIISFLKPTEKMNINSKYKNEVLKNSKKNIRKYILKWCLAYSKQMDSAEFNIPKNVYKRFYPLKYRQAFMEEVFDLLVEDCERYKIVSNVINGDGSLVENFNLIVDVLTESELFMIGW